MKQLLTLLLVVFALASCEKDELAQPRFGEIAKKEVYYTQPTVYVVVVRAWRCPHADGLEHERFLGLITREEIAAHEKECSKNPPDENNTELKGYEVTKETWDKYKVGDVFNPSDALRLNTTITFQ